MNKNSELEAVEWKKETDRAFWVIMEMLLEGTLSTKELTFETFLERGQKYRRDNKPC